MEEKKNDPKSLAMLIASMLIFGSVGIFRRQIPLSSAFLAFSRGILGGLLILAFAAAKRGEARERPPGRRRFLLLVLTGAAIGFNWILLFEAYAHTTVAVATLCYYMQPTIVLLLSPLLFRERLTAKKGLCAAAAILGMVLVSGVTGGEGSGETRGVLLALGAAVLYAAVVILNKRITGVEAVERTTVQLLAAGAVMIPYLLLTGGFRGLDPDGMSLLLLLILGVVHTGLAYLLYFGSIRGLRIQTIAVVSYADPVSALLFSALFLRETLSLPGIIGAVLIIGAALLSELDRHPA